MRPGQFTRKWHRLDGRLIAAARAGQSPAEIAAALGVTKAAVIARAWALRQRCIDIPPFVNRGRNRVPRSAITAPNVIPLVQRALAAEPAAAVRAGGCEANRRQAEASWPLHVAAYVANVELNCSACATARMIGRDNTLVRYAVRRIEERRDIDPEFDAFLDRLGEQARELAA